MYTKHMQNTPRVRPVAWFPTDISAKQKGSGGQEGLAKPTAVHGP